MCSERPGKRYCPAKDVKICAVCCGTKREIEIDCPSSCSYLKASRSYESEKPIPDPDVVARLQRFDGSFLEQFYQILDLITIGILEERANSGWLLDSDVIEVLKALHATVKTLSSGIYYETLPDGPVRQSLFRRLKEILDKLMQPDPAADRRLLKVSEATDILDFLLVVAQSNTSVRPKSRRYLDWISERYGSPASSPQSSSIIIP
ncbi:MAG TPA: hypothetical protein VKY31_00515 [Terriglobia bacterium]|nr:hypothetical protein [Terriglobia bacterium]